MSLVGNLEDLGLGDILQIVSLSRKSGTLSLHSRNREGRLVFANGQVTRATSSVFPENLGHVLLRKKLVDLATLRKALLAQKSRPDAPRIGVILSEEFDVSRDSIEAAVKEQVEKIVYSFFGWNEGTFAFELGDRGEVADTSFDPLQFMLDQGLNPQWLAMEGSRLLDEKRHRGEPLEDLPLKVDFDLDELLDLPDEPDAEPIAGDKEGAPILDSTEPVADGRHVLIVDDDELTRQSLGQLLSERGCVVQGFSGGRDFLSAFRQSTAAGQEPLLLIDLIMPRMDGSGILGGLELLGQIGKTRSAAEVIVLTDHPNEDAERRVRGLGFSEVMTKPKKDALRDASGQRVLINLVEQIVSRYADAATATAAGETGLLHFGRELLAEMGEQEEVVVDKGPESPGLFLLKGMLQELSDPALGGGIILLVLRFASELMNRAVIFLVKEHEIVGLGQFGVEADGDSADARVRRMKLPRQADSILATAIQRMSPMRGQLGSGEWDKYLCKQLGGAPSQEVFLGPILSDGKVVALIYGDNAPEQKPVGDTESFEVFLSQAGLAMEKALAERRQQVRATVH